MTSVNDMVITIEIEPIVKLTCNNRDCRHNANHLRNRSLTCNLKAVSIDSAGQCANQSVSVAPDALNKLRKLLRDTAMYVGDTPVKIEVCGGVAAHREFSLRQLREIEMIGDR